MTQKTDNTDRTFDDLTICRCEGVTWGQLKACIHHSGARTINQVKKLTRAGMGPCQGRTCARSVETILVIEEQTPAGAEPYLSRPPVRGIPVSTLAAGSDQFHEPTGPVSVAMTRTPDPEIQSEPTHKIK
jgi:bacterioferritin-associated ferredoxin